MSCKQERRNKPSLPDFLKKDQIQNNSLFLNIVILKFYTCGLTVSL